MFGELALELLPVGGGEEELYEGLYLVSERFIIILSVGNETFWNTKPFFGPQPKIGSVLLTPFTAG